MYNVIETFLMVFEGNRGHSYIAQYGGNPFTNFYVPFTKAVVSVSGLH